MGNILDFDSENEIIKALQGEIASLREDLLEAQKENVEPLSNLHYHQVAKSI